MGIPHPISTVRTASFQPTEIKEKIRNISDENNPKVEQSQSLGDRFSEVLHQAPEWIWPKLKWVVLPLLLPLTLSGCGVAEEPDPDPQPDPDPNPKCDPMNKGGTDNDGDGFSFDEDCNDCNPNIFPLRDGQTFFLKADTKLCPGTYRDAQILINSQSGVSLDGSEVLLENSSEYPDGMGVLDIKLSDNILVSGLTITSQGTAVHLDNATANELRDLTLNIRDCRRGIALVASVGNTIRNVAVEGPGRLFDSAYILDGPSGGMNRLLDSRFSHTDNNCLIWGVQFLTRGNSIENNVLNGLPFFLIGRGGNSVSGNAITGNTDVRFDQGIILNSPDNRIFQNISIQNGVGITLEEQAQNNSIFENDFSLNERACLEALPEAQNNDIRDNICDQ